MIMHATLTHNITCTDASLFQSTSAVYTMAKHVPNVTGRSLKGPRNTKHQIGRSFKIRDEPDIRHSTVKVR